VHKEYPMGTTKSSSQSTKSITSNSEVKENEPNAIIQPNKDLKNKSLRSKIVHIHSRQNF